MSAVPRTIPAHFAVALAHHGDRPILQDRQGTVTLRALTTDAARAAEGLRKSGVRPGDRIGVYADNSRRWILTDLAIQLAGAVSVPRGTDTPPEELAELFNHAEVGLVFADAARHAKALEAVRATIPTLGEIVCIDPTEAPGRTLDNLIVAGEGAPSFEEQARAAKPEDLVTIIYTSGTTGRPKGVMLSQSNFGHQVATCPGVFRIGPQESFLSVLPPWHIFERTVEYVALCSGARLIYTTRRLFKDDLARYQPTFVPSVPRIWETVYAGIHKALESGSPLRRLVFKAAYAAASLRTGGWDRARGHILRMHRPRGLALLGAGASRLGGLVLALLTWLPDRIGRAVVFQRMRKLTGKRLRGAISGGGLMPDHIDRFLRRIELPILIGYGLTETSPIVCVRRQDRNVLGSIGVAVPEVEMQIRAPETGAVLPPGQVGVIHVRGPNVMQGYYKDEELTRRVIDPDGWFDTGDLGVLTEEGDLCFRGRLKETIVLKGGENIEPSAIEQELVGSPLIEQAVVVGQDRKTLAALVVPDAAAVAHALGLQPAPALADLVRREDVRALLRTECRRRTARLKPWETIHRIALLPEAIEPASGLMTQTLKLRRHVIVDRFANLIEEAYGQ